ncbi:hypothetical protein B0H10DRAFT_2206673 [Mycena sp. CBHHK59/15]|nr:hypothetical protein B0H10DRAFT_2206673 [Mycena sp. CBHHK59/15]
MPPSPPLSESTALRACCVLRRTRVVARLAPAHGGELTADSTAAQCTMKRTYDPGVDVVSQRIGPSGRLCLCTSARIGRLLETRDIGRPSPRRRLARRRHAPPPPARPVVGQRVPPLWLLWRPSSGLPSRLDRPQSYWLVRRSTRCNAEATAFRAGRLARPRLR